ncbi:MAG: iron-containing alcohol dehydrogenase [Candidatus Thiodiazotropha sp.]
MPRYEMRKFVAPEFIFGIGSRHRVGYYARNLRARRVLIVSDPGVIAAGWANDVKADLDAVGIEHVVFHALTPNPKDHEVMAGAAFYAQQHCDVIVAVGGGSVMDCAKGIGIVYSNACDILSFEGVDRVEVPGPPLICIPTTAGTAAEISQFCIVVNQADHYKMSIISKSLVPDVALVDPETTRTMDPFLAACTGIDALTHAIEAYVSTASSPIADVHALAAVELIWNNLIGAVSGNGGTTALENMMLGSLHAGLAFSNASLGAVHAMAHSLGGYLDLPHGECNALLLEHVIRFNLDASADRYRRIGERMGMDLNRMTDKERSNRITAALSTIRKQAGIEDGLAKRGVHSTDVAALAIHAFKDVCLVTNPRRAKLGDIKAIYDEAL